MRNLLRPAKTLGVTQTYCSCWTSSVRRNNQNLSTLLAKLRGHALYPRLCHTDACAAHLHDIFCLPQAIYSCKIKGLFVSITLLYGDRTLHDRHSVQPSVMCNQGVQRSL